MKRIICHWTAGTHKANDLDLSHYHFVFEGDGTMKIGFYPVSANAAPIRKKYAAHTFRCNTDSIGLSLACLAGAQPGKHGRYPMTETQFYAMCRKAAELCQYYRIPVTPKTVLWHAEVSKNLGIAQKGKWDATELSFNPNIRGAGACGDFLRTAVMLQMQPVPPPRAKPNHMVSTPEPSPPARGFWARLFGWREKE
jgi:hypothetical protein